MKQFGNPPFLRVPPTPLSTNPPISEQFFHDSPSCPNFKSEISPPDFREGGGGAGGKLRLSEVMDGNRLN